MDHLQQAGYAIERAQTIDNREHAMQKTQMAIAHAMIALAERVSWILDTYEREIERRDLLDD